MKNPKSKIILSQLIVSFIQLSLICLVVFLEIPTLDFPKTSAFSYTKKIDYWKDLFYPPVDVPLIFIISFFVINSIFLLLIHEYLNHKKSALKIGFWLCAMNNIVLFWACLSWVHDGLLCSVEVLNNADLFFCFDFHPLLFWQILIGTVFTIFIFAIYSYLRKKIPTNQLLDGS